MDEWFFGRRSSMKQQEEEGLHRCGFLKDNGNWAVFHITFFCSSYVVPLVLISVLYLRMLTRLWGNGVGGGSQRGRKRVTRMVVVVVAAFASLWLPIQVRCEVAWIRFHYHFIGIVAIFSCFEWKTVELCNPRIHIASGCL